VNPQTQILDLPSLFDCYFEHDSPLVSTIDPGPSHANLLADPEPDVRADKHYI
jgi:hypothetical protein